jgi:hypothetical protein
MSVRYCHHFASVVVCPFVLNILIYCSQTTGQIQPNLVEELFVWSSSFYMIFFLFGNPTRLGPVVLSDWLTFLAHLAKDNELLPSLGVRRLSSVNFSHFNLLL